MTMIQFNQHLKRRTRENIHGHKGAVVWLTGLSTSGKTTIANHLEDELMKKKISTFLLDGDNLRKDLCSDLSFSKEDREENIKRVGDVAKLFVEAGIIVIVALISPYRNSRERLKKMIPHRFFEVHTSCPLDICVKRDPKGLYLKAKKGEIKNFTGISDPYEEPERPDLIIRTNIMTIDQSVLSVFHLLKKNQILHTKGGYE